MDEGMMARYEVLAAGDKTGLVSAVSEAGWARAETRTLCGYGLPVCIRCWQDADVGVPLFHMQVQQSLEWDKS
jgi:hypothetical protein